MFVRERFVFIRRFLGKLSWVIAKEECGSKNHRGIYMGGGIIIYKEYSGKKKPALKLKERCAHPKLTRSIFFFLNEIPPLLEETKQLVYLNNIRAKHAFQTRSSIK